MLGTKVDQDFWYVRRRLEPSFLQIEFKLKKQSAIRWLALEGDGTAGAAPPVLMAAPNPAMMRNERNWDKIVTEEESKLPEEKPVGDQALNKFFHELYSKGPLFIRTS